MAVLLGKWPNHRKEPSTELGKRIRKRQDELGWDSFLVAKFLGTTGGHLYRIVSGDRNASPKLLDKITSWLEGEENEV